MKLTNENQPMKKKFLVTDKSGRSSKLYILSQRHIETTWDTKQLDDNEEITLSNFLKQCNLGDIWQTRTAIIQCIKVKLLLKNSLHEVVLDNTYPKDEVFTQMLKENNVKMEIIKEKGPSGWPEIKLMGKKSDLHVIIKLAYEDDCLCKLITKIK
jgi:hypothetical protein